ncbi:hypothetical protein GCM10023080_074070 [Streptomyces pseudoechinosporeus]
MARLTGAKVSVLHVAPSTATLAAAASLEDPAEAKAVLDEAVISLRGAGVDAESAIANALTTQIATTISSAAEEWQADLLILSPHHRGALEALINPGGRTRRSGPRPVRCRAPHGARRSN